MSLQKYLDPCCSSAKQQKLSQMRLRQKKKGANAHYYEKAICAYIYRCVGYSIFPVYTLINNVTAHVTTWLVCSQQLASSCQQLFNLHTNKHCLAMVLQLPYKAAFLEQ